jgi:hypothetical protein
MEAKRYLQMQVNSMALSMVMHRQVEGLTGEAAAGAHARSRRSGEVGVEYLWYWYDEGTGTVFLPVRGPQAKKSLKQCIAGLIGWWPMRASSSRKAHRAEEASPPGTAAYPGEHSVAEKGVPRRFSRDGDASSCNTRRSASCE